MQSTKWVHEASWVPKVKVIHWPWSKSLGFSIFKLLLFNNHLADWSQILCGVSLGWGKESLFKLFRSHDHIYDEILKKSSSLESKGRWPWNLVCSIGYSHATKFVKWCPRVDLDLFNGKFKFVCVEVSQPSQQLRSRRASQSPITTVPGQA